MGWTDEMHASRTLGAPESAQLRQRSHTKDLKPHRRRPNSEILPLLTVSTAIALAWQMRKNERKVKARKDPFSRLWQTLGDLFRRGPRTNGQGVANSNDWKRNRPSSMAAAAAVARAQSGSTVSAATTSEAVRQPGGSGGNKKKKGGKKKKKR